MNKSSAKKGGTNEVASFVIEHVSIFETLRAAGERAHLPVNRLLGLVHATFGR